MKNQKYIAYFRVSTQKQGTSGLGLSAQRAAVAGFADSIGGEFTDVESGKNADRPELAKALAACRRSGSTLLIAKLDRLARSVSFICSLLDAGVDFVCADMPEANKFTIHLMAAIGEYEAELISKRTKAALKAARARGVKLGAANPKSRNLPPGASQRGGDAMRERCTREARKAYTEVLPMAVSLREAGDTLGTIAKSLNEAGHTTVRGQDWNKLSVKRLLDSQLVSVSQ